MPSSGTGTPRSVSAYYPPTHSHTGVSSQFGTPRSLSAYYPPSDSEQWVTTPQGWSLNNRSGLVSDSGISGSHPPSPGSSIFKTGQTPMAENYWQHDDRRSEYDGSVYSRGESLSMARAGSERESAGYAYKDPHDPRSSHQNSSDYQRRQYGSNDWQRYENSDYDDENVYSRDREKYNRERREQQYHDDYVHQRRRRRDW